tara:strand:+ start:545 stop:862 length:318 start_codon:yes stop_codon:yes gene_type:complete
MENTHTLKVGDILHCGWGWSMTLNTFYQVVKVTPKTVVIGKLKQKDEGGWPVGYSTPIADSFDTSPDTSFPPTKRAVPADGRVKLNSFSSARLWDGKRQFYNRAD